MSKGQTAIFLEGEGDAWYRRNREALHAQNAVREIPLQMFAPCLAAGESVLEIGCADGSNLALLVERHGIHGHGIEPSYEAVSAGKERHPFLDLRQGTAERLPYPDHQFKLVWFGFCLYLLDRAQLMQAIAEADRVCQEDGFIAITDFDAPHPVRRPYHHRPGVYSWKMDYSHLFLANPAYVLVAKRSYSHTGSEFHTHPDERVATWLLSKSVANAYEVEGESR